MSFACARRGKLQAAGLTCRVGPRDAGASPLVHHDVSSRRAARVIIPAQPDGIAPRGRSGYRQAAIHSTPRRVQPDCRSAIVLPDDIDEVVLAPELLRFKVILHAELKLIGGCIQVAYLVLDGHFGNHPARHMVRQCGLHLISELRCDSALSLPYGDPYRGHGPHRKYGDKLAYRHLPDKCLKETTTEDQIATRLYQTQVLHKEFSQPLNVVTIAKPTCKPGLAPMSSCSRAIVRYC